VVPCILPPFAVAQTALDAGGIVVTFNRAYDPTSPALAGFQLEWNASPVPLARWLPLDATRLRLEPLAGTTFVGHGIPYRLRLDPGIRAADGAALDNATLEYLLRVEGQGAGHVFPAPNPVRPGDASVTFAEAGPETRIDLYTLEGERVRSLSGGIGGGIVWDLRDASGRTVASGTYIYCARDATGSRQGQVVIVR